MDALAAPATRRGRGRGRGQAHDRIVDVDMDVRVQGNGVHADADADADGAETRKSSSSSSSSSLPNTAHLGRSLHDIVHMVLPSLLSLQPIRHHFTRRLDFAVRCGIAFALTGALVFREPVDPHAVIAFLVAIFSMPQLTLGHTYATVRSTLNGLVCVFVVSVILFTLGLRTAPYGVVVLVIFLTSILYTYMLTDLTMRRFALCSNALLLSTGPETSSDSSTELPLLYLKLSVIGVLGAVIVAFVPFPRFATLEVHDRWITSLHQFAHSFGALTDAFCSHSLITSRFLLQDVQAYLSAIRSNMQTMRTRGMHMPLEPAWLLRLYRCDAGGVVNSTSAAKHVDQQDRLLQCFFGMSAALESMTFDSLHANVLATIHPCVRSVARVQRRIVDQLCRRDDRARSRGGNDAVAGAGARADSDDAGAGADSADACDQNGAQDEAHSLRTLLERLRAAQESLAAHVTRARLAILFADADAPDERSSSHVPPAAAPIASAHASNPAHSSSAVVDVDASVVLSPPELPTSPRALVRPYWDRQQRIPAAYSATTSSVVSDADNLTSLYFFLFHVHAYLDVLGDLLEQRLTELSTAQRSDPTSAATSVATSVVALCRLLVTEVGLLAGSWLLSWYTRCAQLVRGELDVPQMKAGIRNAIAISLCSLLQLNPTLSGQFDKGYWAAFTSGILASDSSGGLYTRGMLRALGTLVGGVVGFLFLRVTHNVWVLLSITSIVVMPMMYVCTDPSFSYSGIVSSLTCSLVALGWQPSSNLTAEEFALTRCQEVLIGALVTFLVNALIWPIDASTLIQREVLSVIDVFGEGVALSLDVYSVTNLEQQRYGGDAGDDGDDGDDGSTPATLSATESAAVAVHVAPDAATSNASGPLVTRSPSVWQRLATSLSASPPPHIDAANALNRIAALSASFAKSLNTQQRLITEAASEPAMLRVFPVSVYTVLLDLQRQLWRYVIAVETTLRAMRQEAERVQEESQQHRLGFPNFHHMFVSLKTDVRRLLDHLRASLERGETVPTLALSRVSHELERVQTTLMQWLQGVSEDVRSGRTSIISTRLIMSMSAFVFSTVQLNHVLLLMSQSVESLITLQQQPYGVDY